MRVCATAPVHLKRSLLASLITAAFGISPTLAEEDRRSEITELDAVTVTPPPLNKAFEVNAGAFGAKDTMEVPLAIQSYDAKLISETSPRTVRDVLALDPSVLNSSYGGGFDNFRLRGFAMDNFNTIRRDGLALAPHYDVPLELVERVDVLRGHPASCTDSTRRAAPSTTSAQLRHQAGGHSHYLPTARKKPDQQVLLRKLSISGRADGGREVFLSTQFRF